MIRELASNRERHIARDSKSGHFIPVSEARQRPNTTQVEGVPKLRQDRC